VRRQPELEGLQAAVERLEGGQTFDPKTEAAGDLSAEAVSHDSAKAEHEQRSAGSEDPAKESAAGP